MIQVFFSIVLSIFEFEQEGLQKKHLNLEEGIALSGYDAL